MKREDVKAIIPGITEEQLQQIMDLHSGDIGAHKQSIETLKAERDAARGQLTEASKKLEGYDPEWKTKAEQARQQAEQQVGELKRQYAATRAAADLTFTSESAKRQFLADLADKKLPVQDDGTMLGYDDYVASYKKTDPGAFAPDGGLPRVSGSATGTPATPTAKDQANAALRAAFGHR